MRLSRVAAAARPDGEGLQFGEGQRARRHADREPDSPRRQNRHGRCIFAIRLARSRVSYFLYRALSSPENWTVTEATI